MRYVRLQLQAESAEKPMILQKQAEPTSAPAPAMLEGENSSEEAGPQDGSACEAEDRDGLGYAGCHETDAESKQADAIAQVPL